MSPSPHRLKRAALLAVCLLLWQAYPCSAQQSASQPASSSQRQYPTIWDFLGVQQIHAATARLGSVFGSMPIVYFARENVVGPMLSATGLQPGGAPTSFGPPGPNETSQAGSSGNATTPDAADASAGRDVDNTVDSSERKTAFVSIARGNLARNNSAKVNASSATANRQPAAASAGASPAGGPPAAPAKPPPSATQVAKKLAKQTKPANIKVKVKAIRFLGQQDCICYPEVVDALLDALNDCAEEVRYEALVALRQGCSRGFCRTCLSGSVPTNDLECACCQCQDKVVSRLSRLLLDRNVNATLKETSQRVRRLAAFMIQECLQSRGGGPTSELGEDASQTPSRARPDPPIQP